MVTVSKDCVIEMFEDNDNEKDVSQPSANMEVKDERFDEVLRSNALARDESKSARRRNEYMREWREKHKKEQEKSAREIKLKIPDPLANFGRKTEVIDKHIVQSEIYESMLIVDRIIKTIVADEDRKIINDHLASVPNSMSGFVYKLKALREILANAVSVDHFR
jgi:hypothetical protein